jgi:AbrB family looped-hinge helix DNA binding protein
MRTGTDSDTDEKTTRIRGRRQVTIPKELCEEFGLEQGDELVWEKPDDEIIVRKAT